MNTASSYDRKYSDEELSPELIRHDEGNIDSCSQTREPKYNRY